MCSRGAWLESARCDVARHDTSRRVGVLEGLVYRAPDIDAVERVYRNPEVDWYHQDAREGIAIDPGKTWAPVNSQNTAYRAELAPLMLLPPGLGRFDDIWGSYICQRVLEATDYCVRFGRPFVEQDRNEHDVYRDLEQELFGMRNTDRFVQALKDIEVDPSASVLDNLGAVLTGLEGCGVDLPHLFFREWLRAWE